MFRGWFQRIGQFFRGRRVEEGFFEELEALLVQADVGVETALKLVEGLREVAARERVGEAEALKAHLKEDLTRLLAGVTAPFSWGQTPPTVVLVVGVNGTGKTTTVAKLAHWMKRQGLRPILAAADTFRAAAIEQLQIWAERVGVEMVKHREGGDPSAVVFDAIQAAKARRADAVIADTAGRLHTKRNLMEELKKTRRVVEREMGRPPDEILLVLDATTGQNALSQAAQFHQALGLTGIVLAKMDGTAKGGTLITLADTFKIPIKFLGTGEGLEDLEPFEPRKWVEALFEEREPGSA